MLKQFRQHLVQHLWEVYCASSVDVQQILTTFAQKNKGNFLLDHFAVIDLTGLYSGIPVLKEIFKSLGFIEQGKDYLADKQNDFLWLSEEDCQEQLAEKVLPQVVVADFRLDALPREVKRIVEKYSQHIAPFPFQTFKEWVAKIKAGDKEAYSNCFSLLSHYFKGRDWGLPSTNDFYTVHEVNELLAWVLIFGRQPNHFTLSIHFRPEFINLSHFHEFIEKEVKLSLNTKDGLIKGGDAIGIAQSSTIGNKQTIKLVDGEISLPTGFVEFVWRYPKNPKAQKPLLWKEYFTGFVAKHADKVIESLYR